MGGFRASPSAIPGTTQMGTVTSDLHQITGSVEITGALEVNGVQITGGGGGGAVAGNNTEVQYNNAGSFGASSNLTFTGGNTLNAANVTASAHLRSAKIGVGVNATTQALYVLGESRFQGTTNASHIPLAGGAENVYLRPGTNSGDVIISDAHANQNVGIGISSPQAKLHVSSSGPEPLFRIDQDTQAGAKPILFVTGSGLVAIGTDSPRTDSGDTNRLHILAESGADQGVNPALNSALVVENNDHVAINFITPNDKSGMLIFGDADASNAAYFYYNHDTSRYITAGGYANYAMTVLSSGDSINMGKGSSPHMLTSKASLHISSSTHGNDTGGPVLLKIDHGEDIDKANILFVTGSGRVGINTGTPLASLHISGSDGTDAFRVDTQAASDNPAIFVKGTNSHIGLGTTTPSDTLHVYGNAGTDGGIRFGNVSNNSKISADGTSTKFGSIGGHRIDLLTNNTARVTILPSTGHTGIGVTAPLAGLHVSASATENDVFRIDGISDAHQNILNASATGTVGINQGSPLYGLHLASPPNGKAFKVEFPGAPASEWFSITSGVISFNGGGGTTTAGGIDLGQRFNIAPISAAKGALGIGQFPGSDKNIVEVNSANSDLGGDYFVIAESGSVGIGATAPVASLHISSSTAGNDVGGPVLLKIDHGEDINNANILFVTGSGRVGILTDTPASALDVAGICNATTLSIGGSSITSTSAELNLLDASASGSLSAGSWSQVERVAKISYSGVFAASPIGGGGTSHGLTTTIPDGAVVTDVWFDLLTPFTSDANLNTISCQFGTDLLGVGGNTVGFNTFTDMTSLGFGAGGPRAGAAIGFASAPNPANKMSIAEEVILMLVQNANVGVTGSGDIYVKYLQMSN